jgi:plasmid stability protein
MCFTCAHVVHMSMIQIRNVPEDIHRVLKSRAALAGMSLSDYLLAEIREMAARPTLEEMLERLHRLEPMHPTVSSADIIREVRDRP